MLAATATITNVQIKSITHSLNMIDYRLVHLSLRDPIFGLV